LWDRRPESHPDLTEIPIFRFGFQCDDKYRIRGKKMSETVITTAIITIACVICAGMLLSAVYPAMNRATSSVVKTSAKLGDRIETSIDIIAEANDTSQHIYIWVKNTGAVEISQVENSDIFFGKINEFQRIPFNSSLSASVPSWSYSFENDDDDQKWDTGETLNITINSSYPLTSGNYFVKIVLYNGISDEEKFSI
jgi:archaellum component FlaG (FlaF/FlaG flagellin family)